MANKKQEEETYSFDNLIVGSKLLGDAREVKITVPKSFSAPNAQGNLRVVESYDEVNEIAFQSGKELAKALREEE